MKKQQPQKLLGASFREGRRGEGTSLVQLGSRGGRADHVSAGLCPRVFPRAFQAPGAWFLQGNKVPPPEMLGSPTAEEQAAAGQSQQEEASVWRGGVLYRQVKLDVPLRQQSGSAAAFRSFEHMELEHESELEVGN